MVADTSQLSVQHSVTARQQLNVTNGLASDVRFSSLDRCRRHGKRTTDLHTAGRGISSSNIPVRTVITFIKLFNYN